MRTYVFDASALFAYLQKTPGGPKVAELLKEAVKGQTRILMSAVNYGEVYGRVLRDSGQSAALLAKNVVRTLPVEMVDATPQRAVEAAEIKSTYKLYYADSFAAALTLEHSAILVTSDADFRKLGQRISVVWVKT
jgi:predicted nucleic acid-binding protein